MYKCFGTLTFSSEVEPTGEAAVYIEILLKAYATFFFEIKIKDFPIYLAQIWTFFDFLEIDRSFSEKLGFVLWGFLFG